MLRFILSLCASWLLLQPVVMAEETIELNVPNSNNRVLANYLAGDTDKVAVIILHGFLQTKDFSTVKQLGESLNFEGYTVLQPTLSLGIDRRKNSLRCSSIHTHKLEDSINELGLWVNWLQQQGFNKVVGIGHSFGSLRLIAYQSQVKTVKFENLILTSLVYIGQGFTPSSRQQIMTKAETAIDSKQLMPADYQLSFCKKYTSLPDAFLSYMRWNASHTAKTLNDMNTIARIIIGSDDNRIHEDWIQQLKAPNVQIQTIEGANHFFDAEHEFEIQEKVLQNLIDFGF